jgi:hypothetical protein
VHDRNETSGRHSLARTAPRPALARLHCSRGQALPESDHGQGHSRSSATSPNQATASSDQSNLPHASNGSGLIRLRRQSSALKRKKNPSAQGGLPGNTSRRDRSRWTPIAPRTPCIAASGERCPAPTASGQSCSAPGSAGRRSREADPAPCTQYAQIPPIMVVSKYRPGSAAPVGTREPEFS